LVYKKLNKFQLTFAIITSVTIILFYLIFNLNYLSEWIDERGDSRTYDYYVRLGIPQFLYNPHHIAFDWLGRVMLENVNKNGYTGSSMVILQLRNLIISSIGLGLFFFLFYKISKKFFLSLGFVSVIAFTCAYWIYSQINDTPIIHNVLITLLFFSLIHFPDSKHKILFSMFIGAFHGLAIFFHQRHAIFIFVAFIIFVFANYFKPEEEINDYSSFDFIKKQKPSFQNNFFSKFAGIKYFIIYLLVFTFVVGLGYYYVGMVKIGLTLNPLEAKPLNKIEGASYFFNWLILYAKIDYWGKGFADPDLLSKAVTGISTYFYQPRSINGIKIAYDFNNFFSVNSILPNMIGILFIFTLITTIVLFVPLYKKYGYIFIANLVFLSIYVAFSLWWEPDYREFWIDTMFSFWFLTFFILDFLIEKLKFLKPIPGLIINSFFFLMAILLFYFNFTGFFYPNSGKEFRKFEIINKENYEKNNNYSKIVSQKIKE
jgi:hypothetical protein